jgi:hypothetical protein
VAVVKQALIPRPVLLDPVHVAPVVGDRCWVISTREEDLSSGLSVAIEPPRLEPPTLDQLHLRNPSGRYAPVKNDV